LITCPKLVSISFYAKKGCQNKKALNTLQVKDSEELSIPAPGKSSGIFLKTKF
jgi:hypothetical protein